jgi:hypothetical protein
VDNEAVVVEVLSSTEVVINIGSENGIKEGQRFLVYSIGEHELFDPVTFQPLGKSEFKKGIGRVTSMQDKASTIEWEQSDEDEDIQAFINPVIGDHARRI